MNRP
jgi:hypothetical protein